MLLDPLLTALSWLLGIIVPRDRQLVVIGGRQFGGNTRPLLEQSARYGLRGVWLTGRPEILALGRENVFSTRSLRGLWLGARAGAVLLTHSLGDFSPLYFGSRRVRLYNLWHGMPIKRIARADPRFPKRSYARSFGREMGRYRAMFATSPAMVRLFEESFALPAERIRITGQPRTDALLSGATPDLTGRTTAACRRTGGASSIAPPGAMRSRFSCSPSSIATWRRCSVFCKSARPSCSCEPIPTIRADWTGARDAFCPCRRTWWRRSPTPCGASTSW